MIGNYDKKRKERKALLKELESIKSLLDDGALVDDDFSALTETALSKSMDTESQSLGLNNLDDDENELIFDDADDDDFLVDSDSNRGLDIDLSPSHHNIPVLQEKIDDTTHPKVAAPSEKVSAPEPTHNTQQDKLAPGVLPGQQSLFWEEKAGKNDKGNQASANQATPNKPKEKAHTVTRPALPKTENPFLPKHIRDRLNGTIDLPAFTDANSIIQNPYMTSAASTPPRSANSPLGYGGSSSSAIKQNPHSPLNQARPTTTVDQHTQAIVDAMVSEYMPKIEAQLRQRIQRLLDDEKFGDKK